MGTSLTGLTPSTTYDALIKVGDNGALSATAKYLSDGLGNDSTLALSTTSVGIGTASPTSGRLQVKGVGSTDATNVIFTDNSSGAATFAIRDNGNVFMLGNVGIGTSSPTQKLTVYRNDSGNVNALIENAFINQGNLIQFNQNTTSGTVTAYIGHGGDASGDFQFFNGGAVRMSILKGGGLTFNGDTAAANALDDYEEGTWTPGFTLDSGSVSAFTSSGSYTKIGRQVSVIMTITFTTTLLATINEITGLPFTAQNLPQNAIGAVRESANTGTMWQWRVNANATQGLLRKYDNTQSLANGDTFIGTLTYFV